MNNKRNFNFLVISLFLFSSTAWSQSSDHPVPPDTQVIEILSQRARASLLPNNFEILIWNVLKGEKGEAWAQDFRSLAAAADVVLLQEGMRDALMPKTIDQMNEFNAYLAVSFLNPKEGTATGVISASRVPYTQLEFRRSPQAEPVLNTPKMSLLMTLPQASGGSILIVNTHGINFVDTSKFENQMRDVALRIQNHQGPVIWAGDFNTWNGGRSRVLSQITKGLGLTQIIPEGYDRPLRLDHVFTRGCTRARVLVEENIRTSDHKPLRALMTCP